MTNKSRGNEHPLCPCRLIGQYAERRFFEYPTIVGFDVQFAGFQQAGIRTREALLKELPALLEAAAP